jgi:membrane protein implicated in regulation of membrane protease activity
LGVAIAVGCVGALVAVGVENVCPDGTVVFVVWVSLFAAFFADVLGYLLFVVCQLSLVAVACICGGALACVGDAYKRVDKSTKSGTPNGCAQDGVAGLFVDRELLLARFGWQ